MHLQDGDVVVTLGLNADVADLESAATAARPVLAELGAVAVAITMADPDGGYRGFHVTLTLVTRGETGDVVAPAVSGFTVTSFEARYGSEVDRDRPVLAVPCQDDDVVARVHTRARDLDEALDHLEGATAVEAHPDGDGYAVARFFVLDGDQGLRHAAQPLIDRFNLDAARYTEREHSAWTVGAVDDALYVRQAIDPLSPYDAFPRYEPEELVVRNALTDEEAADLAAFLRER